MHRFVLSLGAGAALSIGLPQFAISADMPVKAPVHEAEPAVVVYDWTGLYIGVNAGYSWGRVSTNYSLVPVANTTLHPKGFIGGAQLGYNWQVNSLVFGVEGDIAWRDAATSSTFAFPNGIDFTDSNAQQGWVGTLRARLGFASNNWLLYVTGGGAWGNFDHSYTERRPTVAGATRTISGSTTKSGWTIGGGAEFGNGPWSFGIEYLYMHFGDNTLSVGAQTLGGVAFPADSMTFTNERSQVVRVKINRRLGGP